MKDEQIIKDFEIIRALYHGNHLNEEDLRRADAVTWSLKNEVERRFKAK